MNAKTTTLIVNFHDPAEFLAELERDSDRIDRRILRVTVRRQYGQPFVTIAVIATAAVNGTIVKLEHRIGETFASNEPHGGLAAKVQASIDKLTAAGKALGLDVRAGVYE